MNYINLLILFLSFIFSQKLITEVSDLYLFNKEIEILNEKKIDEEIFIRPFIEKEKKNIKIINIINELN